MIDDAQKQIASRARTMAVQVDNTVIAMRQRGALRMTPEEAGDALRAIAPLAQSLIRYQLVLLDQLLTGRQPPG